MTQLTEQQIREVVRATLLELGIDASDPIQAQADFQALREWRKAYTAARSKAALTLVGIAVAGLAAMAWYGMKAAITGR